MYNGGEAKWNTVTWGFPGACLQLQDDGNLVLYQDGHAIWTYGSGYKGQILNPGEDVIDLEGQLIRELILDPSRNYQPLTRA